MSIGWQWYFDTSYRLCEFFFYFILIVPLKVINDIEIGLITSEVVEMVDVVDLTLQNTYEYHGEFETDYEDITYVNSVDVTYIVHVLFKYSFTNIEVYEYDKNNRNFLASCNLLLIVPIGTFSISAISVILKFL